MRKKFREFYNNDKIDFESLGKDVLIVFDTNTLLNIYRYSSETSSMFIKSINKVKKNVWIPYQVGLEFNLNRKNIMNNVKDAPDILLKSFESKFETLINQIKSNLDGYILKSTDAKKVKDKILNDFTNQINNIKSDLIKNGVNKLFDLVDTDTDRLMDLIESLDNKVGDSFTQEEIKKICEEGVNRYEKEIPPGYGDKKKTDITCFNGLEFESKYGDLIVWKQIIKRAKDESINTVVLVTDDSKSDWWYPLGGKNIGPRAELKNELLRESNADLIMINSNTFLKQTNGTEVKEDLVDMRSISNNKKYEFIMKKMNQLTADEAPAYLSEFTESRKRQKLRRVYISPESIDKIKEIENRIEYYQTKISYDLEEITGEQYHELDSINIKFNAIKLILKNDYYQLSDGDVERIQTDVDYLIKKFHFVLNR